MGKFLFLFSLLVSQTQFTPIYSQESLSEESLTEESLATDSTNTYSTDIMPFTDSITNFAIFTTPAEDTNTTESNSSTEEPTNTIDLFKAIELNDKKAVTELLKDGADPNVRDSYYRTPIMHATDDNLDIVELLIEKGAYINTRDSSGNTVLMIASDKGYLKLIKLLLNYSVLVNAENKDGVTALQLAVQNGYTDITIQLTDHSANIHASYPNGLPPIFEAVKNGYSAIAQHLLKRGANPDSIVPSTGTSLLSIASAYGFESTVEVLLDAGANPNLSNKLGVTPIFLAIGKKHDKITKLLLEHGASVQTETKDGISLYDITSPTDVVTLRLLQKYRTNE